MYGGDSTNFQGYGAWRGTPVGRQLVSGSSLERCFCIACAAQAVGEMASPGFNPSEISSIRKMSAGRQRPEKSILPSAWRGAALGGPEGACFAAVGGACAKAEVASNIRIEKRLIRGPPSNSKFHFADLYRGGDVRELGNI